MGNVASVTIYYDRSRCKFIYSVMQGWQYGTVRYGTPRFLLRGTVRWYGTLFCNGTGTVRRYGTLVCNGTGTVRWYAV